MIVDRGLIFDLRVDTHNQWFVSLWVCIGERRAYTEFKIDTGCNSLVLSHKTLNKLGLSTDNENLSKLISISGKLASGDTHTYKKLGAVLLFQDKGQTVQICKADAICHSTKETHDLLGTEVLRKFSNVSFGLNGDKYIELKR